MEKNPSIETLWIPKPLKQLAHLHRGESKNLTATTTTTTKTTTTTSSVINSNQNTADMNEDGNIPPRHHHRLHHPRLKKLLAALSFEHTETPHEQQQQQQQEAVPDTITTTTPQTSTQHSEGNIIRSSSVLQNVHRGSLMLADSEIEIFYDAVEYGNSPTKNDFLDEDEPRESIVLAGITAVVPSLSLSTTNVSFHEDYGTDNHVVETVLRTTDCISADNNTCNRTKLIEYTVHDYNTGTSTLSNLVDKSSNEATTMERDSLSEGVPPLPPPAPSELPVRFLRAGKNDPIEGVRRYQATLQMRKEQGVDTILRETSPDFHSIKEHYPHFCHYRGKNNEPCFYEQPPKTNLRALRANGVTLDKLLRHYTMVTEYQWQYIERDDLAKSIYVIDLNGIRMTDFVGEAVDFVKKASAFSAQHYPERAGYVFVINVPGWFKLIWNVVKPIIDEDTLKKIYILRGAEEIRKAMQERIELEFIPPEYGGTSLPLGQSPQEKTLADWMEHNNSLSEQGRKLCSDHTNCKFCTWVPARSY
jgi:CRAL/TRIO domain